MDLGIAGKVALVQGATQGLGRAVAWGIGLAVNAIGRRRGLEHAVMVFDFPVWLLASALAFAIAASLASGVYPASRAARVDPIRALRSG